jgi:hypothetical protein
MSNAVLPASTNGHESEAASALASARRALAQGDAARATHILPAVLGMLPVTHAQHRESRRLLAEAHAAQGNARAAKFYLLSLNEKSTNGVATKRVNSNNASPAPTDSGGTTADVVLLAIEAEPNALATHAKYLALLMADADEAALRRVLGHVVRFAALDQLRDSAAWWRFVVDAMRKVAAVEPRVLAPARLRVELHAYDELARLTLALGAANAVGSSAVLEACGALRDAVLAAQHFVADGDHDDAADDGSDAGGDLLQLHEFSARVHWRYATAFLQHIDSLVADNRSAADIAAAVRRAFDALWRTLSVQMADDRDHFAAERLSYAGRAMYELVERYPDVIVVDELGTPRRAPPATAASDDEVLFADDDAQEPVRDARSSHVAMQAFVINRLVTADEALVLDSVADVNKVVALLDFYFRWHLYEHARTVVTPLFAALYSMPAAHLDMRVLNDRAIGALDVDMLLMALFVDVYRVQLASTDAMIDWALSDATAPPPPTLAVSLARVGTASVKPSAQFVRLWLSMLWQQRLNGAVFDFERPSNVLSLRGVCAHIAAVREALFADALTIAYTVRALRHIANDGAEMLVDIEASSVSPLARARYLEQELCLRVERAVDKATASAFAPPRAADGPAAAAGAVPLFVVDTSLTIASMCRIAGRLESALGMHILAGKLLAASGTIDGSVDAVRAFQRALRQNRPPGEAQRALSQALAVVRSALRTLGGAAASDAARAQASELRDAEAWLTQHAAQFQLDVNAPAVEVRAPPLGAVQANGGAAPPNTPLMRPRPIVQQHGRGTPIFGATARTPLPSRSTVPQTEPPRVAEPESLALPQSRRVQKQLARLAELRAQSASELAQFGNADTSTPSKAPAAVPSPAPSTAAVVRRLEFSGDAASAVPSPFKFGDASAETKRLLATMASVTAATATATVDVASKPPAAIGASDAKPATFAFGAPKADALIAVATPAPKVEASIKAEAPKVDAAPVPASKPTATVLFGASAEASKAPSVSAPGKFNFGAPKTDSASAAPTPAQPTPAAAKATPTFGFGGVVAAPPPTAAAKPVGGWKCVACDAVNDESAKQCGTCLSNRPAPKADATPKTDGTTAATPTPAKASEPVVASVTSTPKFSFGAPKADAASAQPAPVVSATQVPPTLGSGASAAPTATTQAEKAPSATAPGKFTFGAPKTDSASAAPTPAQPTPAAAKVTPTFGFGVVAAPPPTAAAKPVGGWKCVACEAVNDDGAKQCGTCLANRPAPKTVATPGTSVPVGAPSSVTPATEPVAASVAATPKFSFGAPKADVAVAQPTPVVSATQAPPTTLADKAPSATAPSKFTFGAPKTDNASAAPTPAQPTPAAAKVTPTFGFGGVVAAPPPTAAAKPSGGWKCAACEAVNDDSAKQCGTCLANRPAPKADVTPKVSPAAGTPTPAAASATAPAKLAFGANWKCAACEAVNDESAKQCGTCLANRPSAVATQSAAVPPATDKPAVSTGNAKAPSMFQFGAPKDAPKDEPAAKPSVAGSAPVTATATPAAPVVGASKVFAFGAAASTPPTQASAASAAATAPKVFAFGASAPTAAGVSATTAPKPPAADVPKVDSDTSAPPSRFNFGSAPSSAPATSAKLADASKPFVFGNGAAKAPSAPAAALVTTPVVASFSATAAPGPLFTFGSPPATAAVPKASAVPQPSLTDSMGETFERSAKKSHRARTAHQVDDDDEEVSRSAAPAGSIFAAAAKGQLTISDDENSDEVLRKPPKSPRTAHRIVNPIKITTLTSATLTPPTAAATVSKSPPATSPVVASRVSVPTIAVTPVAAAPTTAPKLPSILTTPAPVVTATAPVVTVHAPVVTASSTPMPAAAPVKKPSALDEAANKAKALFAAMPTSTSGFGGATPFTGATPSPSQKGSFAAAALAEFGDSSKQATPAAASVVAAASFAVPKTTPATPVANAAAPRQLFSFGTAAPKTSTPTAPETPPAAEEPKPAATEAKPVAAEAKPIATPTFSFGTVPKPANATTDAAATPASTTPFPFGGAKLPTGTSPFAAVAAGSSGFPQISFPKATGSTVKPMQSSLFGAPPGALAATTDASGDSDGDGDDDEGQEGDEDEDGEDDEDDEQDDEQDDDDDEGELDEAANRGNIGGALGKMPQARIIPRVSNSSGPTTDGDDEDDDPGNIGDEDDDDPKEQRGVPKPARTNPMAGLAAAAMSGLGGGASFVRAVAAPMSPFTTAPTPAPVAAPVAPVAAPVAPVAAPVAPVAQPAAPVSTEPVVRKSLFGDLDPNKPMTEIKFGSQEGSAVFGMKPSEAAGDAVAAEKPRLAATTAPAAATESTTPAKAPAKFNFGASAAGTAASTLSSTPNPFAKKATTGTTEAPPAAAAAPSAPATAKFNFGAPAGTATAALSSTPNPFAKKATATDADASASSPAPPKFNFGAPAGSASSTLSSTPNPFDKKPDSK